MAVLQEVPSCAVFSADPRSFAIRGWSVLLARFYATNRAQENILKKKKKYMEGGEEK